MTSEDPTKIVIPKDEDVDGDNDMAEMKMALEMRRANLERAGLPEETTRALDRQGEYTIKIAEINQRMEDGKITDEQGAAEMIVARREILGI